MIILFVSILLSVLLFAVGVYFVVHGYRDFCSARLYNLSIASQVDSVGGVGISIICVAPKGVAAVVNLLGVTYPCSEVVVAVDRKSQANLVSQLKIRYALSGVQCEDVTVYRSTRYSFRRLVVIVAEKQKSNAQLVELSVQQAIFNYLFIVPSSAGLFPHSVGVVAEVIASQTDGQVDVISTMDRDVNLYSREALRRGVNSSSNSQKIHIAQPLLLDNFSVADNYLTIERSGYNFWDFLSLKIMKYRNKLLSLRKP